MAVPVAHRRQLKKMVSTLNRIQKVAEDLETVFASPKFLAVLSKFRQRPEERKEARDDFAKYLRRQGIKVPNGVIATLHDNNWRVSICIKVEIEGVGVELGGHYDSREGFGWGGC